MAGVSLQDLMAQGITSAMIGVGAKKPAKPSQKTSKPSKPLTKAKVPGMASGHFKDEASPSGYSFRNKAGDIAQIKKGGINFDNPHAKFINQYGQAKPYSQVGKLGNYSSIGYISPDMGVGNTLPSYQVAPIMNGPYAGIGPTTAMIAGPSANNDILRTLYEYFNR